MSKIEHWLTHVGNVEELPYLSACCMKPRLPDVCMRLFRVNPSYRGLVLAACDYIGQVSLTQHEGYKLPHGCSGANCGIPWNIISVVQNRGTDFAEEKIMINPEITAYHGKVVETLSNCGSIRLPSPIKVLRRGEIEVTYYDTLGQCRHKTLGRDDGGGSPFNTRLITTTEFL
jgi:hypothetical protein